MPTPQRHLLLLFITNNVYCYLLFIIRPNYIAPHFVPTLNDNLCGCAGGIRRTCARKINVIYR